MSTPIISPSEGFAINFDSLVAKKVRLRGTIHAYFNIFFIIIHGLYILPRLKYPRRSDGHLSVENVIQQIMNCHATNRNELDFTLHGNPKQQRKTKQSSRQHAKYSLTQISDVAAMWLPWATNSQQINQRVFNATL